MTTSEHAAAAALRYLASEQVCTAFEVQGVVEIWGGDAALAADLLAAWTARGWVEVVAEDGGDAAPVVVFTERGYAEAELSPSAS